MTQDCQQSHELSDKIKELEKKNKHLQKALEGIYEKDDLFMASSRRENEERENSIKLLKHDIDKLSNEKASLQANNQNLMSLLSKTLLISSSIDDHITRRLARILQAQNYPHEKRLDSPKVARNGASNSARLHNTLNEADSNEDLSDEGLDISQRLCDNLNSENSDETIVDANAKLQSSVDRVINMFEETNKQLCESHSIQNQLAEKLLESQKEVEDLQADLGKAKEASS